MLRSLWSWLVPAVTAGRCQRQEKKMMGRGAEGGCGAEERPCPVSRVPKSVLAVLPEMPEVPASASEAAVDFFSQARKALSERSPFDIAEDGLTPDNVPVLPAVLGGLFKHSDSRKRHKKSNSGAEKKSTRNTERSRGRDIWVETGDYFRDLTLPDIDALFDVCSLSSLGTRQCMSIPVVEGDNVEDNGACCREVNACSASGVVGEEEKQERSEQDMEIDSLGAGVSPRQEQVCSVSYSSSSLEWLLGCRNKVYLASERPSKKRKLLGSDAGLQKVFIAHPCEGNSTICDFCCKSGGVAELNPIIVCSSCKVAVHVKCYGIQQDINGSWLCLGCKQKVDSGKDVNGSCVLCPKRGGALKPIHRKEENVGSSEFAHLFCSQWIPEVYVEDLMKLEPIMNVEGIRETRRKLVCNICKIKCGVCVPCSHGTCRTSFHPICAREARHRMEIWGKFGDDNVELRAFCSKHSENRAVGILVQPDGCSSPDDVDSHAGNPSPGASPTEETHSSKIGCRNGGDMARQVEPCVDSVKSHSSGLQDVVLSDPRSNVNVNLEGSDAQDLGRLEKLYLSNSEDIDSSDSLNFVMILKKLIDRGKVNVKDLASEIGISPDSLDAKLADDKFVPDLRWKLVKWLKSNVYLGASQKDLKVKIKAKISKSADVGGNDDSDSVALSDSDISDPVAVKSVPPRRRTKSNIRISRDSKLNYSSISQSNDNGLVVDGSEQGVTQEADKSTELSLPDNSEKCKLEDDTCQHTSSADAPSLLGPPNSSFSECSQLEEAADVDPRALAIATDEKPVCFHQEHHGVLNPIKSSVEPSFYMHPFIRQRMQNRGLLRDVTHEDDGLKGGETCRAASSCGTSVCCNHQSQETISKLTNCRSHGKDGEHLVRAVPLSVLEMSPNDEVEGEILHFQYRLLGNATARKLSSDKLIRRIAEDLPHEIDVSHGQIWDSVLVNKYLRELREAKKLGRKERKHKEAQAVLAAATAAAAASSRISSLRKDLFDGSANQENMVKLNTTTGRPGSLLMQRARGDMQSEAVQIASDVSKEHTRSCDICSRSETIMNPILVCSSCKVAVHLGCYRCAREATGPWYCELCEELRRSGATAVDFWEKFTSAAECAFCGGSTGAFRNCTDGKWIHAFCAEWVLEAMFTRGQVNPAEGVDAIPRGVDECTVCHHKYGACIKCNYGHCQSTFHPSCARSAGLFMNVKTVGGKLQHKGYCGKHSMKAKAESQKHGAEELKGIKQIRVELERLRLLCERIIKREKVKREIVLCSHEILALKRSMVAHSVLIQSPSFPTDGSSESATTSLNYRSGSEAVQKSDEMTVDSSVSIKQRSKAHSHTGNDPQKIGGCSGLQNVIIRKTAEKASLSGKHIPQRPPLASRCSVNDGEVRSRYKKHAETFEKELVMTSDQADLKNKLLPKGYAYVPSDSIPKGKWVDQDAGSDEPLEHGG